LRTISSPANALKIIQRKLNQVLHAVYKKRSPVHGFVRDRSIKTNALRHMGCEVVLNFDLENFFPNVHFGRVKGLFSKKPYNLPDQVALTLAQICCNETVLPAGAPTSPMIANMICALMDAKLKEVAYECDCMYSRYADDITFSTRTRRFDPSIAYRDPTSKKWVVGDRVKNIVEANQFKIHETKTHVRTKHARQEVTGITINERLNVRRQLIRQVRAMLHAWETFGEEKTAAEFLAKYNRKQRQKDNAEFRCVLRGKLEFLGFIRGRDDELYLRLLARFLSLAPEMKSRPVVALATTTDVVLTQAIWLLIGDAGDSQATAFAADGFGLLTAFHTVEHVAKQGKTMYATRPGYDGKHYRISVVKFDEV
jgi:RNA-directed DNA polymerase